MPPTTTLAHKILPPSPRAKHAPQPGSIVQMRGIRSLQLIAWIAGEILISTIAAEDNRDILAGELGDVVSGDGRGVGKRLIVMPDQLRKDGFGIRSDDKFVVVCAVALGHHTSIRQLVILIFHKTDGKGFHWLIHQAGHQGYYNG